LGVNGDRRNPPDRTAVIKMLTECAPANSEWCGPIEKLSSALAAGRSTIEFAAALKLDRGVTGYIYHTALVAIYAWLRYWGDFRATLEDALDCGGDADTVGAIAGALTGAVVGAEDIPSDWLDGIVDWPCSTRFVRRVAEQLA
jgi:ADP-ribosylglycohydrolase